MPSRSLGRALTKAVVGPAADPVRLAAVRGGRSVAAYMVGVAQLVEHRVVVPGVAGSSPVTHPMVSSETRKGSRVTRLMRLAAVVAGLLVTLATPLQGYAVPLTTARAVAVAPAHSAVRSVVPADGAVLSTGPSELVLTFDEKINPDFAQLALTRGETTIPLTATTVTGAVLRATLAPPGPGAYRIAYRVVSADGHPVSGESHFTVQGAPTTAPTAASTAAATASASSAAPVASSSPPPAATAVSAVPAPSASAGGAAPADNAGAAMPWLVGGGVLIALAAVVGLWERSRSRRG